MVNRVALDVTMRGLEQHMKDKGVASGEVIDDGDMGFNLVNVLEKFNDMSYDNAKKAIQRKKNGKELPRPDPIKQASIDKQTAEFNDLIKPTRFLRSDGRRYTADAVTLEGIFKLMLLLEGPIAMDFRAANSDVFMRHLAGDETLDLERLVNSQSSDPIKVALRERIIARNAAAAPATPATATAAPSPSAPAMESPSEPPVEQLPQVGQRRMRESDDDELDMHPEIRLLKRRIALELGFENEKLKIDNEKLTMAKKRLEIEQNIYQVYQQANQNNVRPAPPQLNVARPAPPQPNITRPAPSQPNNARPAPVQQKNMRAPLPKQRNTRTSQPKQSYSRAPPPKQSGQRLTIIEVIDYMQLDNWMIQPDWLAIGRILSKKYFNYYGVHPKFEYDSYHRTHNNVYYVTDRRMMEDVVVGYDNQKSGRQ